MPREGLGYDEVVQAAEALQKEGRQPSIRAVRERLQGTGSPNTIHRHLSAWRAERQRDAPPAPPLAEAIAREIQREIARATSEARAELAELVTRLRDELSLLATAGEQLEQERDALVAQLGAMTCARDQLAGKAEEQGGELERLVREGGRDRRTLEAVRAELAEARTKHATLEAQRAAQEDALARLAAELEAARVQRLESERARGAMTTARAIDAERIAALEARVQAASEREEALRARLDALAEAERAASFEQSRLAEALRGAQAEGARAAADVQRLQGERAALRQELASSATALRQAELEAHRSAVEAARLAGRLETVERARRDVAAGRLLSERLDDGALALDDVGRVRDAADERGLGPGDPPLD